MPAYHCEMHMREYWKQGIDELLPKTAKVRNVPF